MKKKLAAPDKNEKDEGFIKISYLNQENKNTYSDYKQLPQNWITRVGNSSLFVVSCLACYEEKQRGKPYP